MKKLIFLTLALCFVWGGLALADDPNDATIYNRTAAPTASDDAVDGYKQGDIWLDASTGKLYIITDRSVGAAVWRELSFDGGTVAELTVTDLTASGGDAVFESLVASSARITSGVSLSYTEGDNYTVGGVTLTASDWGKTINLSGDTNFQLWLPDIGAVDFTKSLTFMKGGNGGVSIYLADTTEFFQGSTNSGISTCLWAPDASGNTPYATVLITPDPSGVTWMLSGATIGLSNVWKVSAP